MSDTRERSVVVCGEGLVDLVPVGENFSPKLGGGPFNVAIALGRLGSDVGFVSRLSTDAFGDRMIDSLAASNVDTTGVERGPEPTTLAVVNLAADGGARYSFYLEGTADRQFALPKLPSARAFSFGTLSLVLEPGASAYEALLHEAHARGRLTMVDPNIRPAVISDPDAYRRRFRSWLPAIDILKVSDDDAKWLGSVDGAEWLDEGVGAVLLTRGGDGLRLITKELDVSVPAPAVDVADTIGAGDTVHGALLAYLDRHDALDVAVVRGFSEADWSAALTFAARAAAVTVSRLGADPPWSRELGLPV
ncbi:carbohydrate kinase [Rhodococcus sp. C1]|uniref:carbohydrate kinase family protein n=1 Tax=Rhodococcus sp. C1 TaxID=644410 RepID=UPI001E464038|nr:carbohydrate kinase [Rhodococcus sp. C1]UEL31066.1 carbohydrate kinase [Rhodococcus sp. C1]